MEKTKSAKVLLKELGKERKKTNSNKDKIQKIIDELLAIGEYPEPTVAMKNHNYTYLTMVESWGENWHKFQEPLNCPHCNSDLRSESGPPFKREIGFYDREKDRTSHYVCPDCKKTITRL